MSEWRFEVDVHDPPGERAFYKVSVYELRMDGNWPIEICHATRNFLLLSHAERWGKEAISSMPFSKDEPDVISSVPPPAEPPLSRQQLVDGLVEILQDVRSWQ